MDLTTSPWSLPLLSSTAALSQPFRSLIQHSTLSKHCWTSNEVNEKTTFNFRALWLYFWRETRLCTGLQEERSEAARVHEHLHEWGTLSPAWSLGTFSVAGLSILNQENLTEHIFMKAKPSPKATVGNQASPHL